MRNRILYIVTIYMALVLIMMLQKPVFMLANGAEGASLGDYIDVIIHGVPLDMSVAGYFMSIPIIWILVTVLFPRLPVRACIAWWYVIVAIATATAFVADSALYSFWQFKLDASVLFYLQSPKDAAASTPISYIIVKVLEIIIYTTLIAWLLIKATPRKFSPVSNRPIAVICILLVAGCDFLAIRGGLGKSTANIGKVYYSNNTFLNHSAVNPVFSFLYSLGKAEDFGSQFQSTTREEADNTFEQLFPATSDSSVVKLKQPQPNVLMIILEGLGSRFISSLGGAPEVTPCMDSIIASAPIVFTQCYGNSFRTDRALVSALSGHLSYPTTSIMKMPAKSKSLQGIADAMKGAGYDTKFVYGGDINFTNMQSYLRSTGFDTLVSDADFSASERASNAWGVTDHIMFDYLYKDLASRKDSIPWYTTLLTLSSHEPFEVPFDKFSDNPMANAAAYTDHYLGAFIDSIKANPDIWDNTLILISADHGIYFMPDKPRWSPEYFRIPLIITGGAIKSTEQMIIDYPVGQNDIAATLLSILGIPHAQFPYSRNVLDKAYADGGAEVYYSFQNGVAMISDSATVVIDNESDKTMLALPDSSAVGALRTHAKALLQYLYTDLGKR